ncbi:ATP-binding protein [Mangrovibrevibacter kandeliae]|uniref:ATP-binding protein n=1 Tax=Mangrovibrevibacter kandeliae TaxID=2968473 RepID=UPI0021177E18|nr:ATP-binding protein [Aurantimonas sp. CSK15Z-1]MCQ8781346.1 ATP-binding protein [Aurantimonas sp. CSK15Z-1]
MDVRDRPERGAPVSEAASRQNLLLLTQLRWIAAGGQVATILFVHVVLRIPLPLGWMGLVILLLLGLNLLSLWRWRQDWPVSNNELLAQFLMDVAALTAQLYLSGGATNPFISLFLLQIILSAVLLEAWSAWVLVGITSLCFLALMGETFPLDRPPGQTIGGSHLQIEGMFICFALAAGLLVFFINKINGNLRLRDRRLADLRQQASEEEHIVRMGLLASGAAHELGTPLATLSVILNDWRQMPSFRSDPDIAQEMADMQGELDRCKAIVTGILLSSGEARGEQVVRTTVRAFLDDLVSEWRLRRAPSHVVYDNGFVPDQPIWSDLALKQVIQSLFDNAFEASPRWIGITARRQDEQLVLTVRDRGPGFSEIMLSEFGKPYRSSKNRAGSGLGLFLVVNVMRKLGGAVAAGNRAEGGAEVTLTLPLRRLSVEGTHGS